MPASKRSLSECAQEKREEMRLWLSQGQANGMEGKRCGTSGIKGPARIYEAREERTSEAEPRLDGINNLKNELPCK